MYVCACVGPIMMASVVQCVSFRDDGQSACARCSYLSSRGFCFCYTHITHVVCIRGMCWSLLGSLIYVTQTGACGVSSSAWGRCVAFFVVVVIHAVCVYVGGMCVVVVSMNFFFITLSHCTAGVPAAFSVVVVAVVPHAPRCDVPTACVRAWGVLFFIHYVHGARVCVMGVCLGTHAFRILVTHHVCVW